MTRKRRRTTKKTKKRSFWPLLLLGNLVVMGTAIGLIYTRALQPEISKAVNPIPIIEGILVASDVDLNRDLEIYQAADGIPHWKVHLNTSQKKQLIKAIGHLKSEGFWTLKIGKAKWIKGQNLQLVTFYKESTVAMKLILAELKPSQPQPKPTQPEPAIEPSTDASPQDYWESYQGPKIAIIIDDIGIKPMSSIQDLLDQEVPITFAILPFQRFSTESAEELDSLHYEVMLHMPMEPTNFPVANPGAGALFTSFSKAKTQATLRDALDSIHHLRGVNNHMGSKITASETHMKMVMEVLKNRKLFFIDSRTHASTVAFDIAQASGVRSAKRDVFLDATMSYDFTRNQLQETAKIARENGLGIAIGHPYPSTIAALVETIPTLKEQGFSFIFASQGTQFASP